MTHVGRVIRFPSIFYHHLHVDIDYYEKQVIIRSHIQTDRDLKQHVTCIYIIFIIIK